MPVVQKKYIVVAILFVLVSLSLIFFQKFYPERHAVIEGQRTSDCISSYVNGERELSEHYFDSIGLPFEQYIEGVLRKCGAQ